MTDLRAWGRARALGAVDEAERLGCAVVGTEHLLLATLADPVVRWAFRTVSVDVREVEAQAVRVVGARRARWRSDGITPDAAEAVMLASARSDLLDEDDPGRAEIARVHQALARRFLARTQRTGARDVLDGLGLIRYRSRVLATIEHNAALARRPGDGAPEGRRRATPPLRGRLLDRGRRPGPTAGA